MILAMPDNDKPELLHPDKLDALITKAMERLASRQSTGSRYRDLAEVARIHQELGNELAEAIYGQAQLHPEKPLACKAGCSTCCVHAFGSRFRRSSESQVPLK